MLAFAVIMGYMPMSTVQAEAASKNSVKSLKLNKTQYVLKKGKTVKLKATVSPKNAKVTWKSSNKKVATVSSKGVVKAVASKGKVTITAKCGKKKATCKITIGTPVKKITASNLNIKVGESKKIKATISPKNAKVKTLSYESKNKSIATVSKSGKVTGKKSGKAKIVITAKDCGKVKKTITVKVTAKEEAKKPTPTVTKAPTATPTPKGEMTVTQKEVSIKVGESFTPELKVVSDNPKDAKVSWTSSDSNVAAVVGTDGTIQALTPGECVITAVSKESAWLSASYKVKVGEETQKTVTTQEALEEALASREATVVTLDTEAAEINIPSGDYSNMTLVVNAPNAHIVNEGTFKNVLIKGISENTWVERYGNKIYMNSADGHIRVDEGGNPNVYLLEDSEQITVTNDGDLQELLIASAAKVLVKGDSIASRVGCHVLNDQSYLTTYVPLDIYSTTTYKLAVGPGGEQTAIKVDEEGNIPQISGIGTLSVTIDSTGENKTIIAENDGSIVDLPTAQLTGHVVTEEAVAKDAKVYLVSYSKKVDGENISVYLNGASTKETITDEEGGYTFEDVAVGNYIIVVEAEGYELLTQNIYIPTTYADNTYEVEDIILMSEAGQPGEITGIVYNAETGNVITEGLTVFLRKGMNNITSTEVQKVITDENGNYEFKDIVPGQYTIQIRDERAEAVYVSDYYNVSVLSGTVITKNITLSKRLNSQELRFVLTWYEQGENVSEDLDIHLYAPNPFQDGEYAVHFGDGSMYHHGYDMDYNYKDMSILDVDDKEYAGPETITVKHVYDGQYKVFVQDYTNGGVGNSLAASKPEIKVYMGNTLLDTLKMPEKTGGVWYACNYDGRTGKLTVVNDVYSGKPNETTKAKIGKALNQLEQFEVIDVAAFAKNQTLIDSIKENYLKQQDETVLTTYLQQLEELLEKLKAGLTMTEITGNGVDKYTFNEYRTYHELYSVSGTETTLPELNVTFKDTESVTSYFVEPKEENSYYHRLTLKNHTLGVATMYYFHYYQNTEYWVQEINDADNEEWKTSIDNSDARVGGLNASLGRDLEIKLMDGIVLKGIEYKEDLKEEWSYDEGYDAVLHLEKNATGATKDFLIRYIPLGAELNGIADPNNIILEIENNYSWRWSYGNSTYKVEVFGENKELGTTWQPMVREGATYTIQYPDEIEDEYFNAQARVIVNYVNGAEVTYDIYYYQDTSVAEIIGVRDADNMYTEYEIYTNYMSEGREYFNIYLSGTNSKLGTDLKVYTRNGAKAEIEYATASESFEGNSSDAKITVTAGNGVQRIYYVIYKKTNDEVNLRGFDSATNELKKVYLSYSSMYIIGTNETLGSDLTFKTNEGYEASYNGDTNEIIVKETATGEQVEYNVYYTQDTSCVNLKKIFSKSQTSLICDIDYYLSTVTTTEGTEEQYYPVNLVGQTKECPTDLVASVEYGNEVEITYASSAENWIYPEEYAVKILVKDDTGFSKTYLATYKQDDSQAVIKGIFDENNAYVYSYIRRYTNNISCEDGTVDKAYIIQVIGTNETLGDTYELELPNGTKIAGKIKAGEEGWNYGNLNTNIDYTDEVTGQEVRVNMSCVEKIVVEAANGAQKTYAIYYGQDESGAVVSGISDSQNAYTKEPQIMGYTTQLNLKEQVNDASSEEVYVIYVKGNNAELGDTYQLSINETAKIVETTHVGKEAWNYEQTELNRYYYENDVYITETYAIADRVVIQASNGAERVYVIAYVQDTSGTVISKVTDTENTYLEEPRIENNYSSLELKEPVDEVSWEKVYMIYVYGKNATLGTTYQLEIPEGSVIESTVSEGDAEWNYNSNPISYTYYTEENGYVTRDYFASERVVVKASNGAERVYVIAYAADESGVTVKGITDANNSYSEQPIIATEKNNIALKDAVDESGCEEAYLIYVYGESPELGNTYELEIPEGSEVSGVTHVGDEDWNYALEQVYQTYWDENNEYVGRYYTLTDRVVIKAANGVERIYIIAYAHDSSKATVTKIEDTENAYVSEPTISDSTTNLQFSEEVDGVSEEDVYMIYVCGSNKELGSSYQLTIPEGGSSVEKVSVGEEGWNYQTVTMSESYEDENGDIISIDYIFTDRVVVQSTYGAKKIYVIAYAQDETGAVVSGFTDESNILSQEVEMPTYSTEVRIETGNTGNAYQEVYVIAVVGANEELGNTYQLALPEGAEIVSTTHVGDEAWKYAVTSTYVTYTDAFGNYANGEAIYTDEVLVRAANGAERTYLIAYFQDTSGTLPTNISDENNEGLSIVTCYSEPSEMDMTALDETGAEITESKEVYLIVTRGANESLGNSYVLELPEGATEVSRIDKTQEEWKYQATNMLGYICESEVVVRAANGAERTYLIVYEQAN